MQTEPLNISEYIKTETDIDLFIHAVGLNYCKNHTKETDDTWTY